MRGPVVSLPFQAPPPPPRNSQTWFASFALPRASGITADVVRSQPRDSLRKVGAGADAELAVDVAQVVLDRLRAEEHRRRRLARRPPAGEEERDLELLRRELIQRRRIAPACGLARRAELGACQVRPRRRAERVECLDRRPKLPARTGATARTTLTGAVREPRASRLEDVRRLRMELEGHLERALELVVAGEEPARAGGARERPRLALRARSLGGAGGGARRFPIAPEPEVRLGQLRPR